MTAFLSIEKVSKSYGQIRALDGVSVGINENEFFALLGPSGCGKTTLLRAMAGFETLDQGAITLDQKDLLSMPANKRPLNLMFQSYALFPHLNVYDNIAYGLRREKLDKGEVASRVEEILKTVSLSDHKKRMPSQLSGGQKQRVALARAIVKRPKILLLDEPLSALDKKVRSEMQFELKRLQHEAGITFIIVTHDQEEAMSIADRIALMDKGKVIQVSTPLAMYRNPSTKFVADFIGINNIIDGVLESSGVRCKDLLLPINESAMPIGNKVCMIVRPESVKFCNSGLLTGVVVNSNFFGDSSIVYVDCGLENLIKISCSAELVPQVGQSCSLTWAPDDCILIANN